LKQGPNVLIVVLDAVRARNLSCYGYSRNTSPEIDRIAEQATLYTRAVAPAGWTLPSHASMFTGLYPHQHNCHAKNRFLDDKYITLAEILSANGYGTGCFSANPWLSRKYNCSKGFEDLQVWKWQEHVPLFLDALTGEQLAKTVRGIVIRMKDRTRKQELGHLLKHKPLQSVLNYVHKSLTQARGNQSTAANMLDHVSSAKTEANTRLLKHWIRKQVRQGKPFFAFCNDVETHVPYLPPRRFRYAFFDDNSRPTLEEVRFDCWDYILGKVQMSPAAFDTLVRLYDGAIMYVSSVVGDIYGFLQRLGIEDNTLLIITSDHGENLGDHNLMGHVLSLHETITRVPLIMAYPQGQFRGERMGVPAQLHDLFQTIIRTTGVDFSIPTPSMSLYPPDLTGESLTLARDGCLFAEYLGNQAAIETFAKKYPDVDYASLDYSIEALYSGAHKYTRYGEDERIYDITNDESEAMDLSGDDELLDGMRLRMASFKAKIGERHEQYLAELPGAREKLRVRKALGGARPRS